MNSAPLTKGQIDSILDCKSTVRTTFSTADSSIYDSNSDNVYIIPNMSRPRLGTRVYQSPESTHIKRNSVRYVKNIFISLYYYTSTFFTYQFQAINHLFLTVLTKLFISSQFSSGEKENVSSDEAYYSSDGEVEIHANVQKVFKVKRITHSRERFLAGIQQKLYSICVAPFVYIWSLMMSVKRCLIAVVAACWRWVLLLIVLGLLARTLYPIAKEAYENSLIQKSADTKLPVTGKQEVDMFLVERLIQDTIRQEASKWPVQQLDSKEIHKLIKDTIELETPKCPEHQLDTVLVTKMIKDTIGLEASKSPVQELDTSLINKMIKETIALETPKCPEQQLDTALINTMIKETIQMEAPKCPEQQLDTSVITKLIRETMQLEGPKHTEQQLDTALINKLIREAIEIYDHDKTGLADYAMESAGGSIIGTRCTKTYNEKSRVESLWGVPLWYVNYSPRTVIQRKSQGTIPGECWCFEGETGYLTIQLSKDIHVTQISYEHVPAKLVPTGEAKSAPKKIQFWSYQDEKDPETKVDLGEFVYDNKGKPLQFFQTKNSDLTTSIIEVEVKNNYGSLFTCLYRLRVHGHLPQAST
uniref:SUN domain-containing protein n=1 Tax=Rhabditophanes sp. KR3021 TaxID=114890 RepID=A0AC35TVQ3_9BILA